MLIQYQHLYLDLNGEMNSPPSDHLRFCIFALGKKKLKKQKRQCSQNLDLNPACGISSGHNTNSIVQNSENSLVNI